jgi:hypothetical protein
MKALVWKRWLPHMGSSAEYTEQTIEDSLQGVAIQLAVGRELTGPNHNNIAVAQYHEIYGMV